MIRQPIITVLGHVDHGKTALLDKIRGTAIAAKEAGGITQHIGATEIPISAIKKICKGLLETLKIKITIPGLLFIDTPGHEAFTNLRARGGSISDLAILVIDIVQGFQPQTIECVEILRKYKVPFIVAANKIDLIDGWQSSHEPFTQNLRNQRDDAVAKLEERIYKIVEELAKYNFNADRFDRVTDFTKQICIVPISAKTGEGIAELLMILTGLAQKYLEDKLKIEVKGPGKGVVLDVKKTLAGIALDVILYDGHIKQGDTIVLAGKQGPIITKIRAILKPKPLSELRESERKFRKIDEAYAAAGIRILAKNIEEALAGSPLIVAKDIDKACKDVQKEIAKIIFNKQNTGAIVKADTLGSLEALTKLLEGVVPIRKADVGNISRADIMEVKSVRAEDPLKAVIFGFNVYVNEDAKKLAEDYKIKIFLSNVIYKLKEDYEKWIEKAKKEEIEKLKATLPAKIKILPGYIFRQSKPAIFGIEVICGTLKPNCYLMRKDGRIVGRLKSMQEHGENIKEAKKGKRVAIAVEGLTIGRQANEGDMLYVFLEDRDISIIEEKLLNMLSDEEKELLNEIKRIKIERV